MVKNILTDTRANLDGAKLVFPSSNARLLNLSTASLTLPGRSMLVKTERLAWRKANAAWERGGEKARKRCVEGRGEHLIKNRGLASHRADAARRVGGYELRIAKFIPRCKNRNGGSRFLGRHK